MPYQTQVVQAADHAGNPGGFLQDGHAGIIVHCGERPAQGHRRGDGFEGGRQGRGALHHTARYGPLAVCEGAVLIDKRLPDVVYDGLRYL